MSKSTHVWRPSGRQDDWFTPAPVEVHQHLIAFVDLRSLARLTRACQTFRALWEREALWRLLWERDCSGQPDAPCGIVSISRSHLVQPASGGGYERCVRVVRALLDRAAKREGYFDLTDSNCQYGLEAMYFVRRPVGSILLLQPFVDAKTMVLSVDEAGGSFKLLAEKALDQCFVYTLNFSEAGDVMFQGGDGVVSVWDISSPDPEEWILKCRLQLEVPPGGGAGANHVSCIRQTAHTGNTGLLCSSKSGSLQWWDSQQRTLVREVIRAPFPVTSFSLDRTGGLLFVASGATLGSEHFGAVTVWDFEHGEQLQVFYITPPTALNGEASLLSLVVHGRFLIATDNCYVGRITVFTISTHDEKREERAKEAASAAASAAKRLKTIETAAKLEMASNKASSSTAARVLKPVGGGASLAFGPRGVELFRTTERKAVVPVASPVPAVAAAAPAPATLSLTIAPPADAPPLQSPPLAAASAQQRLAHFGSSDDSFGELDLPPSSPVLAPAANFDEFAQPPPSPLQLLRTRALDNGGGGIADGMGMGMAGAAPSWEGGTSGAGAGAGTGTAGSKDTKSNDVIAEYLWSGNCRGTAGFSIFGNLLLFINKAGALACHELSTGKFVKDVIASGSEKVTDYELTGERLITFSEAVSRDSDMVLRAWRLV